MGHTIDTYSSDKKLVEYYNDRLSKYDQCWHANKALLEKYFERVGIRPAEYKKITKTAVKRCILRHMRKREKKRKAISSHEMNFFQMMYGASLLKKLKQKGENR